MLATDINPSLRIEYPCPTGKTLGSLSRVLVYNGDGGCNNQIVMFVLDFQRDGSTAPDVDPDVQPYRFEDGGGVPVPSIYDINVTRVMPCNAGANGAKLA